MGRVKKYKRYSPEFKREALRRSSEDGVTDKSVSAELVPSGRRIAKSASTVRTLPLTNTASPPPLCVAAVRFGREIRGLIAGRENDGQYDGH